MDPATYLGRLLRREDNVATLLAYLIAQDSEPLRRLLDLPTAITDVRIEVTDTAAGRYDLVLTHDAEPVAVLELKVSATEHGDQFSSYAAAMRDRRVPIFLLDLEADGLAVPQDWRRISLDRVFDCWSTSEDETTNVVSRLVAEFLRSWRSQLDGPIGGMDRSIVAGAMRAAAEELHSQNVRALASGTVKGKPGLVVWRAADEGRGIHFVVDVRKDVHDPAAPWLYRVGIDVSTGSETADEMKAARVLAHSVAMDLESFLRGEGLQNALREKLPSSVSDAVRRKAPLGGLRNRNERLARWLTAIDEAGAGGMPIRRHPVFNHDWGTRLAAPFVLDVTAVGREELIALTRTTLDFLEDSYRALAAGAK